MKELEAEAERLGFAALGATAAQPPPHASALRSWLAEGMAAGMDWMARTAEKRQDPALVLPGVRSVVVVAMNYWQGPGVPGAGRIARYALGEDYHSMILKRLEELARVLERKGGTQKIYVDTGPVLEREFAALAGVGWQGKSTMVLSRRLGKWILLGVILTTLELPAGQPARNYCGRCERCIQACPTQAIIAPYRLDARRCLSYLTIEHKGPIPEEFRRALGGRIFGCDECLEACPWNRFAQASREMSFQPRAAVALPMRDYLRMDDAAFREAFRRSPIRRLKRARFLRNVCVALGNVGCPEDVPVLRGAAQDSDPLIAEHAQWAIEEIARRYSGAADSQVSNDCPTSSASPAAVSMPAPSATRKAVVSSASRPS